jgi:HTH-type transcriptional regulator, sugar sensing transcriptional regulator
MNRKAGLPLIEAKKGIDSLTQLGLTDLEARIYILLLKQSPLSGYGVAKILGRSVPNIYNTLSAMSRKGLVMSSRDKTTNIFVPTPLEEYLKQYSRRSEALVNRARKTLQQMDLDEDEPRPSVYKLENTEQVIVRTIRLIESAEVSISIAADRFPLLQLSAYLSEASGRGVNVLINSYIALEVPGCDVVHWQRRQERKRWPGNILIIAVDGREMITACFSFEEKVIDALLMNNPYLVTAFHHGRSADTLLASILNLLKKDVSIEKLRESIETLTDKHIFGIPHSKMYESLLSSSIEESE